VPKLRCLSCAHEQRVEDLAGAQCARCGAEFVCPPQPTTHLVIGSALLGALSFLLLVAGFAFYLYLHLTYRPMQ
jgi:hypothetical protein